MCNLSQYRFTVQKTRTYYSLTVENNVKRFAVASYLLGKVIARLRKRLVILANI